MARCDDGDDSSGGRQHACLERGVEDRGRRGLKYKFRKNRLGGIGKKPQRENH